jgi:hypothetical protein
VRRGGSAVVVMSMTETGTGQLQGTGMTTAVMQQQEPSAAAAHASNVAAIKASRGSIRRGGAAAAAAAAQGRQGGLGGRAASQRGARRAGALTGARLSSVVTTGQARVTPAAAAGARAAAMTGVVAPAVKWTTSSRGRLGVRAVACQSSRPAQASVDSPQAPSTPPLCSTCRRRHLQMKATCCRCAAAGARTGGPGGRAVPQARQPGRSSSSSSVGAGSGRRRSRGVRTADNAGRCAAVPHLGAGAGRRAGMRRLGTCTSCRLSRSNGLVQRLGTGATAVAGVRRWTGAASGADGEVIGGLAVIPGVARRSRMWRWAAGIGRHVGAAIVRRMTTGRGDQTMLSSRWRLSSSRWRSQQKLVPGRSSSARRGRQTGRRLYAPVLCPPVQLGRRLLQALHPLAMGSRQSSHIGSGLSSRMPQPSHQRASSERCGSNGRSGVPRLCSSSCGPCTSARRSWSPRPGGSCCR